MTPFSYKTIESETEGLYKEKGSKFYALAFPVENEEEIKSKLDGLRKKYFDARHHCYAYRIGTAGEKVRANDDGEPNHSAGDPILGQIRSKELTNTLIVVVRYFGGIKLGVGGLIAAYRSAAESALSNARIVEKEICCEVLLNYKYPSTGVVMKLVKQYMMSIKHSSSDLDECTIAASLPVKFKNDVVSKISMLQQTGTEIKLLIS
jgi:uncharacterized YigZ family protein